MQNLIGQTLSCNQCRFCMETRLRHLISRRCLRHDPGKPPAPQEIIPLSPNIIAIFPLKDARVCGDGYPQRVHIVSSSEGRRSGRGEDVIFKTATRFYSWLNLLLLNQITLNKASSSTKFPTNLWLTLQVSRWTVTKESQRSNKEEEAKQGEGPAKEEGRRRRRFWDLSEGRRGGTPSLGGRGGELGNRMKYIEI